jgi:hypothetical protein
MSRFTNTIVAVSTTAMLIVATQASAHGGGGHASFGSFAAAPSHSYLGSSNRERRSNSESETRGNESRAVSHAGDRHSRTTRVSDSRERQVRHEEHERTTRHTPLVRESRKDVAPKLEQHQKRSPAMLALTDKQFANAKLADGKGRLYDAMKKTWTDGKGHWWYGRYAWLFIDGDWYYGSSPWTFNGEDWSMDDDVSIACASCKPVRSATPVEAEIAPSEASAPKVTDEANSLSVDDVKRTKSAAVAPSSHRMQPTSTAVTTKEMPSVETASPVAASATAETQVVEKSDTQIECKRFLPNLSLTITVPCQS